MESQSNIQILEAILKRELQSEQTKEINNLKELNYYCPQDPDRVFLLDEDETPNLIGYVSPSEMGREDIQELLRESPIIWDFFGIKIYKLN